MLRDRQIRETFDGGNHKRRALRFGVSERHVRRITARRRVGAAIAATALPQPRLTPNHRESPLNRVLIRRFPDLAVSQYFTGPVSRSASQPWTTNSPSSGMMRKIPPATAPQSE